MASSGTYIFNKTKFQQDSIVQFVLRGYYSMFNWSVLQLRVGDEVYHEEGNGGKGQLGKVTKWTKAGGAGIGEHAVLEKRNSRFNQITARSWRWGL